MKREDVTSVIVESQGRQKIRKDCLAYLSEAFTSPNAVESAKCAVIAKYPSCKDDVSCDRSQAAAEAKDRSTPKQNGVAKKSINSAQAKQPSSEGSDVENSNSAGISPSEPKNNSSPSSKTSNGEVRTADSSRSTDSTDPDEGPALSECRSLASAADAACSDSDSSGDYAKAFGDGLTNSCDQMQNSGLKSATSSNDKSNACFNAYSSCSSKCAEYADKYQDSDSWSDFNSTSRTCMGYKSRMDAMNKSTSSSLDASKAGTACATNSAQSPQSVGSESNANSTKNNAYASGATCSGPDCPSQSSGAAAATAEGGFGDATKKGIDTSFDVVDTASQPEFHNPFGDATSPPSAPAVKPIATNTGGAVGGAGGASSNAGARSGPPATRSPSQVITDIEQGFRSAGPLGALNALFAGSGENGSSEAGQGRTPAAVKTQPKKLGNLADYLPGGPLAPGQFHPQATDIFSRITSRMRTLCARGELYDCN